jgi:exportin-7
METLAQLEALCERLYNSQDSVERAHAESTLKCFSSNTDYISQCQYVLDNASSSYALMLASSSLLKQVTEQSLPLQLRIDIRNILTFLLMIITRSILGDLFVHFPNQILLSVVSA